jgi:hypothetical protein
MVIIMQAVVTAPYGHAGDDLALNPARLRPASFAKRGCAEKQHAFANGERRGVGFAMMLSLLASAGVARFGAMVTCHANLLPFY